MVTMVTGDKRGYIQIIPEDGACTSSSSWVTLVMSRALVSAEPPLTVSSSLVARCATWAMVVLWPGPV